MSRQRERGGKQEERGGARKEEDQGNVSSSHGRMMEVTRGSPPANMSSEARRGTGTGTARPQDQVVPGRLANLDAFPPRDFRGKFKKMRHKKRPTILESRFSPDSLVESVWQLWGHFRIENHVFEKQNILEIILEKQLLTHIISYAFLKNFFMRNTSNPVSYSHSLQRINNTFLRVLSLYVCCPTVCVQTSATERITPGLHTVDANC